MGKWSPFTAGVITTFIGIGIWKAVNNAGVGGVVHQLIVALNTPVLSILDIVWLFMVLGSIRLLLVYLSALLYRP